MVPNQVSRFLSLLILCGVVAGCGAPNSDVPVGREDRRKRDFGKVFGEEFLLFGGPPKPGQTGVGMSSSVNPLLWRASLDTLSFMPLASTDSMGGVIVTEWYQRPDQSNERHKITVRILDRQLRADALQVKIFKQTKVQGGWQDGETQPSLSTDLEDIILTRARQLRVQQRGS